jgi:hypothetical protein
MSTESTAWKRCSTCKKDIAFATGYYACNVSTCNRPRTALAFCTVDCWDAHVPLLRHRDSWAEEKRSPRRDEWERQQREEAAREAARASAPPRAPAPQRVPTPAAGPAPREILVVASRLKDYIRARSGYNTSDGVLEVLSDKIRRLCDDAIVRARESGRQTVMDRDF